MAYRMTEAAATPLQRARCERGWKQSRTLLALRQQADRDQLPIASPASLKTMLSRWENGQGAPGAVYQDLFCKIYNSTASDLGFEGARSSSPATPWIEPRIDTPTVDYFKNVFHEHLRADNLMGPHHLVDVVNAQAALLERVIPNSRGAVRRELLVLGCRYSEFAGWLWQDAGDPARAMNYTDRAMDYALEIGDVAEVSYVLMRKANIACDQNKPDRAVGLTEAALRNEPKLPAQIRALILAQRGRALASLREPDDCARTLDQAFRSLDRPGFEPDDRAGYCNQPYIAMEAASCWNQLGKPDKAAPIFERSSLALPASQRRDHGLCLSRLASAYAGMHDKDRVCDVGARAIAVVQSAPSARALRELQRLDIRMAPWRRESEVHELSQTIRRLLTPTR